jgi:hypothetical protein
MVAVLVAFIGVQGGSGALRLITKPQVRTVWDAAGPPGAELESVLGATPHEFESRILRPASPG